MTWRRLIILFLLLTAGSLGGFALQTNGPTPVAQVAATPTSDAPVTVRVLSAARNLSPGTLIGEADMASIELPMAPEGSLPATAIVQAEFRGALVRRFVPRGAPISRDDVLHPGERGFLAAVLSPGHRAISIGVDAVTGAGGLVAPGDHVDLVLVQNFAQSEAPVARRVTAETVLSRVRVIAIDQQITQGGQTGPNARVARTVTLEVTPEAAERVAVAEQLGRLAVTVRPALDETEQARSTAIPVVFGGDVSNALGSPSLPTPARMRVIQGADASEVTFR
jgi:pilus assembly protein CpaB